MKKVFSLIKFEFLTAISEKSFWFFIIAFPLTAWILGTLPDYFDNNDSSRQYIIGTYIENDKISDIFPLDILELKQSQPKFIEIKLNSPSSADSLLEQRLIDAFVYAGNTIEIKSNYSDNSMFYIELKEKIISGYYKSSLERLGADSDIPEIIYNSVDNNDENVVEIFFRTYFFLMLFILFVLFSGGKFIRSFMYEKSSNLIEILITSTTPMELFTGKLFGLIAIGIFQLFIWSIMGLLLNGFSSITIFTDSNSILLLVYFVLGYIFYGSIFLSVGVYADTESKAFRLTGLFSMFLLIPLIFSFYFISSGETHLSEVMLYFPFTSSSTAIIKLISADNFSILQELLPIIVLIFSILLSIYVSSVIFKKQINKGLA